MPLLTKAIVKVKAKRALANGMKRKTLRKGLIAFKQLGYAYSDIYKRCGDLIDVNQLTTVTATTYKAHKKEIDDVINMAVDTFFKAKRVVDVISKEKPVRDTAEGIVRTFDRLVGESSATFKKIARTTEIAE